MDARLTDEQKRIRETAEEFIVAEGGIDLARRRMDGETDVVDELWAELAALDYTAITVPLAYDGFGEGMVYLTALLEVAGRYALPGPLPETAAVAVPLIDELGTDDQRDAYLPRIANGQLKASFALHDETTGALPDAIGDAVRVSDDGLTGTKPLVPYGGDVDLVCVVTRTGAGDGYDGLSVYLVETDDGGVTATERRSFDRTRPMYELGFDGATATRLGPADDAGEAVVTALDRYTVASTAMLVGAAHDSVEMSVEHGTERQQYGQPVGRFQAVKHRIADAWVDAELARSQLYYAAWALAEGHSDATHATASLKAFAADRLARGFSDGMKNHGGMGFTWDHDDHIYHKQAKAWRNFPRSPEDHADRLIDDRLADRA